MVMRNGQAELLYPFAKLVGSSTLVLPSARGIIGDMAGQEFYDPKVHKGHLVCPECEQAKLGWRRGKRVGGDDKRFRDHFFMLPNEQHSLHCRIGELGLMYPDFGRRIDERKGGYVYANLEPVSPTEPPVVGFRRKTSLPNPQGSKFWPIPNWAQRIQFGEHRTGFREIVTADFVDRPRYRAISDVGGFIKLLTHIPKGQLKDTWVIRNGVALRLDKLIVREGKAADREQAVSADKRTFNLPHDFLMAANRGYDRFARVLNDNVYGGMRYPILLHFKRAADNRVKVETNRFGDRMVVVTLPEFKVQNPARVRGEEYSSLELPFVTVERKILCKDPALFDVIKRADAGQEFFAVAHPNVFRLRGANGRFVMDFEVLRASDLLPLSIADVSAKIDKIEKARATKQELPSLQFA